MPTTTLASAVLDSRGPLQYDNDRTSIGGGGDGVNGGNGQGQGGHPGL